MLKQSAGYKLLFIALIGALLWVHHVATTPPPFPPGPAAPDEPEQGVVVGVDPWTVKEYTITPLATYKIRARVLRSERYYFDREADLSPVDLALGWGSMSDSAILDHLSFLQYGRSYYFRYSAAPLPNQEIVAHSANTHILPASPFVAEVAKSIKPDDIIRARGYLVSVRGNDGYQWISSLSRTDTGPGSCEVFWVQYLAIERR